MIEHITYIVKYFIEFNVPGVPVAWHRSGYNRHTGMIFKNKKDTQYQALIKAYAIENRPRIAPEGPVALTVRFYMPCPQYHKKDVYYWHTKKPDLDNLVKNIKDAMSKSMYHDDAQIVAETISKHFSDKPRAEIRLDYLDESIQPDSIIKIKNVEFA